MTDKTSSRFRSLFESFSNSCTPFLNAAKYHHSIPAFRDRFDSLRAACDRFCMHTCISNPVPVSTTPSVHHTSCSAPKGAPIPVKVPNFDGNPLHWEKFEAEFSTAIRTRPPHYSNFDVRCLLTDGLTPENDKNIITHCPDKDTLLPELLRALKREYGTPVIVGPILIDKLLSPHTFDLNHSGFTGLNEHFIQPFNALVSLIGDSLSTFMAMFAKKYLSPACCMEWEKYTKDLEEVPNMKHLKAFIETWKVLVPSEFPLVGAPASPMPAHPSFANYPSTSNHRLRPDIKPPPPPTPKKYSQAAPHARINMDCSVAPPSRLWTWTDETNWSVTADCASTVFLTAMVIDPAPTDSHVRLVEDATTHSFTGTETLLNSLHLRSLRRQR